MDANGRHLHLVLDEEIQRVDGRTRGGTCRRGEAGSDEQQLQRSVRPSVRQSALSNSCRHHHRRFDWIDNKTLLQNCGLLVRSSLGKRSERTRLVVMSV